MTKLFKNPNAAFNALSTNQTIIFSHKCYFINFKLFINAIKYQLQMRYHLLTWEWVSLFLFLPLSSISVSVTVSLYIHIYAYIMSNNEMTTKFWLLSVNQQVKYGICISSFISQTVLRKYYDLISAHRKST